MVAGVLERLDLGAFAGRRLGTLSGGERQRLVIARALAQEAPILLLDEPTSALDIGHQQQALELVARLRRDHGLTVVSAMHDLTLAGLYSDRLALLHEGRCVAAGPAADVLAGRRRSPSSTACRSRPPRGRRHRRRDPAPRAGVDERRTGSRTGRTRCRRSRIRSASAGPHVPRKYGWMGPGSSSAGWTTRHVRSTTSSRAKRRGEPSRASLSRRSYASCRSPSAAAKSTPTSTSWLSRCGPGRLRLQGERHAVALAEPEADEVAVGDGAAGLVEQQLRRLAELDDRFGHRLRRAPCRRARTTARRPTATSRSRDVRGDERLGVRLRVDAGLVAVADVLAAHHLASGRSAPSPRAPWPSRPGGTRRRDRPAAPSPAARRPGAGGSASRRGSRRPSRRSCRGPRRRSSRPS